MELGMRLMVKTVLLAIALLMGIAAFAQTFEQALDAYERKDYKAAFAAFLKLAEGGDSVSPVDDTKAVAWYRKAAERGEANAQYILGLMYLDGRGVPQDDRQAENWYRKAAEQGYASAQVNLGLMYVSGRGVSKDDVQAVAWLRKAADQGNAYGQHGLGLMYMVGRGLPKDNELAYFWFLLSGGQGYKEALLKRDQVEPRLTPQQRSNAKAYAKAWKRN